MATKRVLFPWVVCICGVCLIPACWRKQSRPIYEKLRSTPKSCPKLFLAADEMF